MRALRVVAADARLCRASKVEVLRVLVRVRARSRVDDGVRAVERELLVSPRGALGPFVGAVADFDRRLGERLARIARVEVELDHLPVALVEVVEVVEGVEEPVLKGELARARGFGGDVRVHGRLRPFRDPARPALVVATWLKRAAREIEVVLVEADEIPGARSDLHEVDRIPGAAQRDGRLVEERVHVHRLVRFSRPTLVGLLHQADDRRVPLGESLLVAESRGPARRNEQRDRGQHDHCRAGKGGRRSHDTGFDANNSIPRRRERNERRARRR